MAECHLPPAGFRGAYRSDPVARAVYSESAGIARVVPAAVAVPSDADDVVTLVRWATERSLSLIPRGSGSSMAGGAIGAGIVVDMSRLNDIGAVDVDGRSIGVGPGALRGDVDRAAAASGLRFPVDPSSGEFCTIGGMVATNAAGAHSLAFGPTRPWVLAVDCVLDDGARVMLERGKPIPAGIPALDRFSDAVRGGLLEDARDAVYPEVVKNSSGYAMAAYAESGDVIDLLVGSEGTLALIVGIELGLTPAAGATSGVLGAFASLDDAVDAAIAARAAGAVACELLDKTFLEVAASGGQSPVAALVAVPPGTEAVLLAEVEGASQDEAMRKGAKLAAAFDIADATVANVAIGVSEQREIWELRHAASPILSRLDPALKSMQFVEDGAVPPIRLAEYVRGVRRALDERGIRGVIFGHAGDAHIHVNPLIDVRQPDWRAKVEGLLEDIVALTAKLGGTLSGEHGDGRLRTPLMSGVWDPKTLELFARVKAAFDPKGILNPGVKVPLSGQRALGDIKYDPALAPLPPEAREALDKVTDNRAYATPRLSMIPGSD